MHWLWHYLGLDNASGGWYLFWSGIFGDVGIFGAVFIYFRHQNCHAKGCPRVGRFQVDGTPYRTCHKHHPEVPDEGPSAEHIADAAQVPA